MENSCRHERGDVNADGSGVEVEDDGDGEGGVACLETYFGVNPFELIEVGGTCLNVPALG